MELLDHRRRRSGIGSVRGDDVAEGEASNQEEVQTALSQEGQPKGDPRGAQGRDLQMTPKSGMETAREAISPGALELGLVASPFHSELIRSEVALRRTRPLTLDQDARSLAPSNRSFEEPRSSSYQEGVRVARVDTSSGAGEATEPVGRPQSFGPSGHQAEGETQKPPLAKGVSATTPGGMGSCPSPEEVRGSSSLDGGSVGPMEGARGLSTENQVTDRPELALALLESRSEVRPEPADSRELVPAGMGMSGALEQMLVQVVEENRLLRMRLEWAGGGPMGYPQLPGYSSTEGPPVVPFSEAIVQTPMSFAPGAGQGRVEGHPMDRAVSEDPRGLESWTSRSVRDGRSGGEIPQRHPAVAIPGWELGSAAESLREVTGMNWQMVQGGFSGLARQGPSEEAGRPFGVPPLRIPERPSGRELLAGNERGVLAGSSQLHSETYRDIQSRQL